MYTHVVMWRFEGGAGGMSRPELAAEVKRRLDALPTIIKEIRQYDVGINIGDYGASFFDVALISTFDTRADFQRYTASTPSTTKPSRSFNPCGTRSLKQSA